MRAIIIGAGVAGLAASIRLATKGYSVAVFEANAYAGGKLTSIKRDGYRFDAGPSLFTMPQYVDELIAMGSNPVDFTYRKKEVVCHYFFHDETRFKAYADQDRFIDESERILNADGSALRKYLANARKKYELTAPVFLKKSLHQPSNYFSKETLQALLQIRQLHLNHTLDGVNGNLLKGNNKLVQLFNRFATYNGSSPYKTPGIMSLIPHLEQHYGTFFPKGGMIAITKALLETARGLGVRFHFEQPVEEIIVDKKRATGVVVNDDFIPAELVMSNMDVVPTYRKLLPKEKAPERSLRQERSSSAIIFYWGMEGVFPELDLHNIFFSSDYRKEFNQIFDEKCVPEDPTIYINISSREEPDDAPPNCENWFVMINAPSDIGQNWEEERKKLRDVVMRRLSKSLNRNIEELIAVEEYLDPTLIESRTSSYRGALYGAASNNKFAAFLRHPNFSQRIKNLYFCGGSVHPGGGIPLCLLSAKIAANLIPDAHG